MGASILDDAVERTTLGEHDGRSGSTLERVRLRDGTRLVVKRSDPATDIVGQIGGSSDLERQLWAAGVLDRLPAGIGHAIVDGWKDGDHTVVVMRDVGDAMLGWDRRLSRDDCRRVLNGAASMHRAFRGETIDGLVPLVRRLTVFAPSRMAALEQFDNDLPKVILNGWDHFRALVPEEVSTEVFALLEDAARFERAFDGCPRTLLHGDFWLVNMALEPEQVTLIDWSIASHGPAALEFGMFLIGNASNIDATREEIVDDFRAACGDEHDERALQLALVHGLCEMGWNKALDAATNDDPAKRALEQEELDWWVATASKVFDAGLV